MTKDPSRPLYLVCKRNLYNFYERLRFKEVEKENLPTTLQKDYTEMLIDESELIVMKIE